MRNWIIIKFDLCLEYKLKIINTFSKKIYLQIHLKQKKKEFLLTTIANGKIMNNVHVYRRAELIRDNFIENHYLIVGLVEVTAWVKPN